MSSLFDRNANDGRDESPPKWERCPCCGQKMLTDKVSSTPAPVVIPVRLNGILYCAMIPTPVRTNRFL
jgi:hypothetical protein